MIFYFCVITLLNKKKTNKICLQHSLLFLLLPILLQQNLFIHIPNLTKKKNSHNLINGCLVVLQSLANSLKLYCIAVAVVDDTCIKNKSLTHYQLSSNCNSKKMLLCSCIAAVNVWPKSTIVKLLGPRIPSH